MWRQPNHEKLVGVVACRDETECMSGVKASKQTDLKTYLTILVNLFSEMDTMGAGLNAMRLPQAKKTKIMAVRRGELSITAHTLSKENKLGHKPCHSQRNEKREGARKGRRMQDVRVKT